MSSEVSEEEMGDGCSGAGDAMIYMLDLEDDLYSVLLVPAGT